MNKNILKRYYNQDLYFNLHDILENFTVEFPVDLYSIVITNNVLENGDNMAKGEIEITELKTDEVCLKLSVEAVDRVEARVTLKANFQMYLEFYTAGISISSRMSDSFFLEKLVRVYKGIENSFPGEFRLIARRDFYGTDRHRSQGNQIEGIDMPILSLLGSSFPGWTVLNKNGFKESNFENHCNNVEKILDNYITLSKELMDHPQWKVYVANLKLFEKDNETSWKLKYLFKKIYDRVQFLSMIKAKTLSETEKMEVEFYASVVIYFRDNFFEKIVKSKFSGELSSNQPRQDPNVSFIHFEPVKMVPMKKLKTQNGILVAGHYYSK